MKVWITRDCGFTTLHTEKPIIEQDEDSLIDFWYSASGETFEFAFPDVLETLQDGECKEFEMTLKETQSIGIIK